MCMRMRMLVGNQILVCSSAHACWTHGRTRARCPSDCRYRSAARPCRRRSRTGGRHPAPHQPRASHPNRDATIAQRGGGVRGDFSRTGPNISESHSERPEHYMARRAYSSTRLAHLIDTQKSTQRGDVRSSTAGQGRVYRVRRLRIVRVILYLFRNL